MRGFYEMLRKIWSYLVCTGMFIHEKSDWDLGLIFAYNLMFAEVNNFFKGVKVVMRNHAENIFNPTEPNECCLKTQKAVIYY